LYEGLFDLTKESIMVSGKGMLAGLVIGAIGASTATSEAALVVNLRFDDGSLTKDVTSAAPGTQYTVDVWMSVTGSAAGAEGFQGAYFGVQSDDLTTNVTGDITGRSRLAPFNAAGGSDGTIQSLSLAPYGADDIDDLGGPNLSSSTGFMRAYAGSGTFITAGGTSITDGVEFKVATVTFTLGAVNTTGALPGGTTSLTLNPILPGSLLASTRATWTQDGVNVNAGTTGTGGYSTGSSVSFTVIPEPATLGLLGLGSLLGLRRRRH
jgi:hypothetical protein